MSAADDYLFLQPLIEARLLEQLGSQMPIEGIESVEALGDSDKRQRVAYVMWAGDRVNESEQGRARAGSSQLIAQRWMVLLRIANASQVDRAARNREAGQWLKRIHAALAGWVPPDQARPFMRCGSVAPSYAKTSALYPLGFEITLNL